MPTVQDETDDTRPVQQLERRSSEKDVLKEKIRDQEKVIAQSIVLGWTQYN